MSELLKDKVPTFYGYWERRQEAKQNQLPKHLRPLPKGPIRFQIMLNLGILAAILTMMWSRDEYVSEAGPAIGLVVCFLLLIYALISAFQLRARYAKTEFVRSTKINIGLMVTAFLSWTFAIIQFLP